MRRSWSEFSPLVVTCLFVTCLVVIFGMHADRLSGRPAFQAAIPDEHEKMQQQSQATDWEDLSNRDRDSALSEEEKKRTPRFGGVITIQHYADPSSLNNLTRSDRAGESICLFLYPRLLQLDPDSLELLPFTAVSLPEISEDRKVHTWRLRPGLKWDDFETSEAYVTTRDVKCSFGLMKEHRSNCPARADFEHLIDIKVVDETTFQAVYDQPNPDAVYKLGHKFRIVPAHLLEEVPPSEIARHPIGREPVGYGPFRFKHWKQNDEVLLVRNDWNREIFPEKFRPHADGIRIRTVRNPDMVLKTFLKGEIDLIAMDADTWKYETVKDRFTDVATRHFYYIPWWNYIAWNNRSAFFGDARVRRAMTHLVRRDEVLKTHRYGMGKVLSGPFYYYSKAYDHSIDPLKYDPEEAVRLLEKAGWKDRDDDGVLEKEIEGETRRFEFALLSPSYLPGYQEALLLAFQEDLRTVGVLLNLRKLEWSALEQHSVQRNYDALTSGFRTYPLFEDPFEKWHSSLVHTEGVTNNKACYGSSEVDRLVEQIRLEFDDEKRYDLLNQVHALIHRDQPFTFLYSLASLVGINKRWRGVKVHKTGVFIYEWWLPPEKAGPSDQVDL